MAFHFQRQWLVAPVDGAGDGVAGGIGSRIHLVVMPVLLLALSVWQPGELAATTFKVANGTTLEGEVIRATSNTVTLRLDIGTMLLLPRSDILSVSVATDQAGVVEGSFADWRDGIYQIRVGANLLTIKDNRVLQENPPRAPIPGIDDDDIQIGGQEGGDPDGGVRALDEAFDAFLATRPALRGKSKEEVVRAFIQYLSEPETASAIYRND